MSKDMGGNSGSREPSPSSTGLGPSGFDPGRVLDGDDRVLLLTHNLARASAMLERVKPLRCRFGFHKWSESYTVNGYARFWDCLLCLAQRSGHVHH